MTVKDFLKKHAVKKDNKVFIPTEFEFIEVSNDKLPRYQGEITGAIRCYSKKADLYTFLMQEIKLEEVIDSHIEDFDEAIDQLSESTFIEEIEDVVYPNWQRGIFFLPSYWEAKIAAVVQKKIKTIDYQLKYYIPDEVSEALGLNFIEEDLVDKKVLNKDVGQYSTSFFKVFDKNNEEVLDCDILEKVFCMLNKQLGGKFIDTYFCVGSVSINCGLFLPSIHDKIEDPRTKHYSFWKLRNSPDFCNIALNFEERKSVEYLYERSNNF